VHLCGHIYVYILHLFTRFLLHHTVPIAVQAIHLISQMFCEMIINFMTVIVTYIIYTKRFVNILKYYPYILIISLVPGIVTSTICEQWLFFLSCYLFVRFSSALKCLCHKSLYRIFLDFLTGYTVRIQIWWENAIRIRAMAA
jgi:hypothetical protein